MQKLGAIDEITPAQQLKMDYFNRFHPTMRHSVMRAKKLEAVVILRGYLTVCLV